MGPSKILFSNHRLLIQILFVITCKTLPLKPQLFYMEKSVINNYIDTNKERMVEELIDLLRIPSVSADRKYKPDVLRTAEAVKQRLIEAGADKVELSPTNGYPVVYGEKIIDPQKPTVIVYGHYDVQPADPVNLWN